MGQAFHRKQISISRTKTPAASPGKSRKQIRLVPWDVRYDRRVYPGRHRYAPMFDGLPWMIESRQGVIGESPWLEGPIVEPNMIDLELTEPGWIAQDPNLKSTLRMNKRFKPRREKEVRQRFAGCRR